MSPWPRRPAMSQGDVAMSSDEPSRGSAPTGGDGFARGSVPGLCLTEFVEECQKYDLWTAD